ncbi:MAG TPA: PucR family transcriptional regulator ligand-binding domain-containing protein [Amycolatopsis sp.]|uniref:PucR family transcriptional regulator n=1 Tax=Amycolatopsis sp. TaxID=37632 RepID=UPI002B48988C|nr:PucR family transcriptional regulator ligand-binding domain-containing protein [Amycolatopsis sp.]HKS43987.1 PucR family transcriptional regulator ligand-binding domain-containing protein [Amycolatopsis sp.]
MTLVKTLLEIPGLRLRVRTGSRLLGRAISRIYVTELPDPSRYVSAGELVLSGLLWWRRPGDAERFVGALARAGVAAFAASGADTGGIPDDVIQACAQHGIPLLEVPADLSFAVITERVVLALAADRGTAPGDAHRRLLSAAGDMSLPVLLRQGAIELGAPCWVISGTGRVVAGTEPDAPAGLVERFAPHRPVHGEHALLPIGGRFRIPWLLAIRATSWPEAIADELAGLIGLARARADQVRQTGDRAAAPLFRLLAGGAGDPAGAFAATGLPAAAPVRVLLARTPDDTALGLEVFSELLADVSSSAGVVGDETYAVVAADEKWPWEWPARASDALSILDQVAGLSPVFIGIGGPATVSGLRGASQEARYAVEVAARRGERIGVVAGEDIPVHRLLVAGAPDELRRSVRDRVLGPLLAYDQAQGTDLVRTVRVFLESACSPTAAAKALHVHVNTLRYRIARACEVLGLDLTDFPTQVDVYLALEAR